MDHGWRDMRDERHAKEERCALETVFASPWIVHAAARTRRGSWERTTTHHPCLGRTWPIHTSANTNAFHLTTLPTHKTHHGRRLRRLFLRFTSCRIAPPWSSIVQLHPFLQLHPPCPVLPLHTPVADTPRCVGLVACCVSRRPPRVEDGVITRYTLFANRHTFLWATSRRVARLATRLRSISASKETS